MTATSIDDAGLCARLRDAVEVLRAAEFTVARAAAELDVSGVADRGGYRSGRRLVEELARVDPGTAKRWITHGTALTEQRSFTGEAIGPVWPATAKAAEAGTVGSEHVRVIARGMDAVQRVPGLDPATVADAERTLAHAAEQLAPRGVEKVAVRLLAHLDPDGVAPLDPPMHGDELHLSTSRRDGTVRMAGRFAGATDTELLREVFDAISAPAGPEDTRPVAQRRADALLELLEQATGRGGLATDNDAEDAAEESAAPVRGRPLLLITIDHRDLQKAIGHGLLDSDRTVAAGEARRLGCDAGLVPTVLGTRSQPLDVGRLAYTVPDPMRRALHARDRGCAFPGCDRRPRRCHAHHVQHWADGGATALDNLVLLCRFHHQLIHHDHWRIHIQQGRPWFTPPGFIDPTRTPRPGGPHPLGP